MRVSTKPPEGKGLVQAEQLALSIGVEPLYGAQLPLALALDTIGAKIDVAVPSFAEQIRLGRTETKVDL